MGQQDVHQQVMGVFGKGVMGRNLALNIERRGHEVSIFNITCDLTDQVIVEHPAVSCRRVSPCPNSSSRWNARDASY